MGSNGGQTRVWFEIELDQTADLGFKLSRLCREILGFCMNLEYERIENEIWIS